MITSVRKLITERQGVRRRLCVILISAVVSVACWCFIYIACCLENSVEKNLGSPLPAMQSHDFIGFASTRTNPNYLSDISTACVVDPAVTKCIGLGFGGFLRITLQHTFVCQALGCSNVTFFGEPAIPSVLRTRTSIHGNNTLNRLIQELKREKGLMHWLCFSGWHNRRAISVE